MEALLPLAPRRPHPHRLASRWWLLRLLLDHPVSPLRPFLSSREPHLPRRSSQPRQQRSQQQKHPLQRHLRTCSLHRRRNSLEWRRLKNQQSSSRLAEVTTLTRVPPQPMATLLLDTEVICPAQAKTSPSDPVRPAPLLYPPSHSRPKAQSPFRQI